MVWIKASNGTLKDAFGWTATTTIAVDKGTGWTTIATDGMKNSTCEQRLVKK
jgi:hypothetical protein